MRLKRIYVKSYKNLKEFNLNFEVCQGLTILVGNNGCGKSNVLELISGIFHDAYHSSNLTIKTDYSLEYIIEDTQLCIKKQSNKRIFYQNGKIISRNSFIRDSFLPSDVIAVYSGEENRLWTQYYESFYMKYVKRISNRMPAEKMKLLFINKFYWNIALLTILLSPNETLKPFIVNDLKIDCSSVLITFTFANSVDEHTHNAVVSSLLNRINPELERNVQISLQDLHNLLYFDIQTNTDGTTRRIENGVLDAEIFFSLVQAYMPKKSKTITDILIEFNGISTQYLSEGEKKLILVKAALEFLSDEKSLLLLDEPDAHINEGRKQTLYRMFSEYDNRQIVLTSHSPTMVFSASPNQLVMLETEESAAKIMSHEKIEMIQRLAADNTTVIEQSMIFKSTAPLIVFEGKTDILYVKRALELLKQKYHLYKHIDVNFISANGSGNAKSFLENLIPQINPEKRVIVFFDRDDAGKKGAAAITGVSKDSEAIVHFQDIVQGNITATFIPYKEGIMSGEHRIEDYFNYNTAIKSILDKELEKITLNRIHPVRSLPNLSSSVKSELEKNYLNFSSEEFEGYTALLNKIIELTT